ncbi:hypothetical protein ABZT03_26245 [Streptomyces sp. NPDC005574]|uniref:hypothetical protein n=1 Tax=Streptomyces sp. NPDC005574 TaxID=3156891 RepID=UPI00339E55C9
MKARRWDFISAHADDFGVQRLCRVLQVSRSGYYRWIAGAEARAARQAEEDALVEDRTRGLRPRTPAPQTPEGLDVTPQGLDVRRKGWTWFSPPPGSVVPAALPPGR